MKLYIKTGVLLLIVLNELALIADPPKNAKWKLIPELSDEFNGTSLDSAKWADFHSGGWKGRNPSQYLRSNVSVSGGNLLLAATVANADKKGDWLWSSCVSSKEKNCFYGYYEARIKASKIPMTSSFWFQGKYSEIDVCENNGAPAIDNKDNNTAYLMRTCCHYFPKGWSTDKATSRLTAMKTKCCDEYHIYGVEWDTVSIKFYLDNVQVFEVKHDGTFNEKHWMYFDTEAYIWDGLPTTIESVSDPSKNKMLVDWVRSYKKIQNK